MCLCFCVDAVVPLTNKHDLTSSTAAVKKIGKISSVQEDKSRNIKSSTEPKEREQPPEGIRLKKGPVKAPETVKQVLTHVAEVTRHHDLDLSVHGLHDRKERDIVTLRRSELITVAKPVQSRSLLQSESVASVEEVERAIGTISPGGEQEDKPQVPDVEQKKVDCQWKEEEQKERVKLKPLKELEKREENPEHVQLKKVPLISKEPKEEVATHRAGVTRHHDSEVFAAKLALREDEGEHLLPAAQELSDLRRMEELHKFKEDEEKNKYKTSSFEEPDKDLTKRKKSLPQKGEEQEVVKLRPFEKAQESETQQPSETKESEPTAESSLRDHVQPREDQQEAPQRREPGAAHTPVVTRTEVPSSRPPATARQQEDQADAASEHRKPSPAGRTPEDLQPRNETPVKKKPGSSEKEAAEEKTPENQTDANKKEPKAKMTPSFKAAKGTPGVKPVEQIQKVELKKTASPNDREQKVKKVETGERLSTIRLKTSPPRAAAPGKPEEEPLHLVKQVSPGAVQVKKVPTRLEEEAFEEVPEDEEEEEVWGWELLPSEGWTGEGLDGAVETPGPPGSKRGEVTVVQPPHSSDLP